MRTARNLLLGFVLVACKGSSGEVSTTGASLDDLPSAPTIVLPGRPPGACWTLLDAEEPDTLRAIPERRFVFASARGGLVLADVAGVAPITRPLTQSDGAPLGVFVRGDLALVVFAPSSAPATTVARAVSIAGGHEGRRIGEVTLDGRARDVRRAGESIVVTRDLGDSTVMTALVLEARGLVPKDEVRLAGSGSRVGGSPLGLAVARPAGTPGRSVVSWVDVDPDEPGRLHVRGTLDVRGMLPRWRSVRDAPIDVSEDAVVRFLACTTAACAAGEDSLYTALDFGRPATPRLLASTRIAPGGEDAYRFFGEGLVIARAPAGGAQTDATDLVFFRARPTLSSFGSVRVAGVVASLALRGDDIFALGATRSQGGGRRAVVHRLRAEPTPRPLGSASLGADGSWSAADDAVPMSFDPGQSLAAVALTSAGAQGRSAVAILSVSPGSIRVETELPAEEIERIALVDGRAFVFSASGVRSTEVRPADELPPAR